jgi:hypothetical protein
VPLHQRQHTDHLMFSALSKAQSTGLHDLLTSILWILTVGTRKFFGEFSSDQWLRGNTARSIQCLWGDSNETRNFGEGAHFFATKSWKLCWNAWEPHRTSAVRITLSSPMSQQLLVPGNMLTGTFCSFRWVLYPLKTCNLFVKTLYKHNKEVYLGCNYALTSYTQN